MAKEEIVFEVSVDGSGSGAKSLKTLKAEFKQLQQELDKTEIGTKSYQQALERLGNVRDEIGDLNQTINALNPEGKVQAFANVAGKLAGGFQAATGAAALFGVQSEELEKQLLKVQAATALAQGIQSVVGLTDAFKVLGAVIAANPIMFLSAALLGIVAATVAWVNATDEETVALENLNKQLERQGELIKENQEANDLYTRQLKANGATEKEILEESIKQAQSNFDTIERLAKTQLEILKKAGEDERAAENKKYIDIYQSLLDADIKIQEARKALTDFNIKESQREADEIRKINESRAKEDIRIYKQFLEERAITEALIYQSIEVPFLDSKLVTAKLYADKEVGLKLQTESQKRKEDERTAFLKNEISRKEEEEARLRQQREFEAAQNYFSAVGNLSATYFNLQLASAEGNAKKQEEIRKKQFNVDKAVKASQATIDAIKAVNATLAQGGAFAVPLAISVGVAGFANVTRILSQQYQGSQQNNTPNVNAANSPQIQTSAPNTGAVPLTRLNEQGQNLSSPVRAYVVETDVSESQQRIRRLEEQSTF